MVRRLSSSFYRSLCARAVMRVLMGLVVALLPSASRAGHYSGGSITWECLGAGQYEIHLDLFLDCSGFTIIPQDILFSSDCGTTFTVDDLLPVSQQEVSQLCAAQMANSTCNGGALPGIMWYEFVTVQNLPPCDSWNVSWNICCRSNAVSLVGNQGMYIDAEINTLDAACDNSPVFTDQSLPYVCVNQPVYYNFGVNEPDGNALAYSLVSGQLFAGTAQNLNYMPGFTGGVPVPGITVDPITGQISFTPTVSGNYVVVMQVEEYDNNGNLIGVVMRDIVFVVIPCTGNVPETQGVVNNTGGLLTGPSSIEVCDGEAFCVDILFTDADPGTVLQVVSQAAALLPGSTFNVLGSNPATARICWTGDLANTPVNVLIQADDGNCPIENTASIAVNITTVDAGGPAPSPGTNGSAQVCPGSGAFFLISVLGGTPDVNGYWTDPNGNPHNADFDPITDPAGVYVYTVGTACANATSTATVTYLPAPNAGVNANLALCANAAPSSLMSALGGTPDTGGTWTAPGGGPFSGNYDAAIDVPGAYTYTVAPGGGCPPASATVTVSETLPPVPGTDGTATFCSNGGVQNLLAFLGGVPQAGGTWTAPGGGAFSGSYNPAAHGPGVYTYTVTGTAPCANGTATVTVTENALPVAGTSGAITVCTNAASFSLPGQLGGSPEAGGAWTAPGGGAHGSTYDPATDVPGVYTYTVTGTAPCQNMAATVTVTENLAPNAGSDGSLSVCSNGSGANLVDQLAGAQSNGTWVAPGGAPSTGVYTPAVDDPGIYTYTVTGMAPCLSDQAIVTVTESAPPDAGGDGSLSICGNNLATNLQTLLTGAQGGGTWTAPGGAPFPGTYDPAIHDPGIYTYTVAGVAPCPSDVATVTINENIPPVAGADAAITLCSSSPATALFPLLTGAGPGGTWFGPGNSAFNGTYDPAVNVGGVYTYTILGVAPCQSDFATVTVTENQAPSAGIDGTLTLCDNSGSTGLLPQLVGGQTGGTWTAPGGGAYDGTYDPATDGPGIYTYTLIGLAPCVNDQATVTVTENPTPLAGADGSLVTCGNSPASALFAQLTGADAGGSWTDPGAAAFSGAYDPTVNGPGTYTYTVVGTAPCANDQAIVTVTENAVPNAGSDAALSTCSSSLPTALLGLITGAQAGGTWTAPGGAPFNGSYDPASNASGVYTYTVNGIAPCAADQAFVTVTEEQSPSAGADGILAVCGDAPAVSLFPQLVGAQAGGTWTDPGGVVFSGTYDPATDASGAFVYTVNGTAPCPSDQATVTVTENLAPDAGIDGALTICGSDLPTSLFPLLGGAQAGGSWTAPGGGAFSGVYDPTLNAPGLYTYTITGIVPCVDDIAVVTVTEDVPSTAMINYPAPAFCGTSGPVNVTVNGTAGGAFSAAPAGLALNTTTGSLDPSASSTGQFTVSYALPANGACPAVNATSVVDIVATVDAGVDASITVCEQGGPMNLLAELSGAQAGGTWTAPGGGAFSGTYDPATDGSGVYQYAITATAPCPNDQATVTVNETGTPDAGTDGTLAVCATGAPTALFPALGGGAQLGGTWTAPGGAPHGGMLDPASDAAGVYVYTLTATAPCMGDQSEVLVTINAAPQAGSDGAITVCDLGAPTPLFPSLSGAQAGGLWTDPGGGAFSGTYDPAVDVSGSYTYTVNGIAPCLADQAVVVVNETGTPNAGSDGALTLCSTAPSTALFAELTGAQTGGAWTAPGGGVHSGVFDPSVDPPGNYTYTLTATAPCVSDFAQVVVSVEIPPQAGTDGSVIVCDQGPPVGLFAFLSGADAGGSWTAPGGGAFLGTYDPLTNIAGAYTYTVNGAGSCADDQATVTVTETGSPNAGTDGVLTLCDNGAPAVLFNALGGTPQAGGVWTAPGGVPHGATLDPGTDQSGVYTYVIAGVAPCAGDQAQITVVIHPAAQAGADGALTVCDAGSPIGLIASLVGAQGGGTWSAPGGAPFTGVYDPSSDADGVYTYTVQGLAPCTADQATVTVTETGSPFAGVDGALTLCATSSPADLLSELAGAQAGGSWTGPSGAPHTGTIDPTSDVAGTYTYTLSAAAPCVGDVAHVDVSIVTPASAGADGSISICDQGGPVNLATALSGAAPGGSWTAPGGGAFPGTYDPLVDGEGVYTYTVSGTLPCPADQAAITVLETGSPDAGTDGSITLCESAPLTALFALLGGADAGGTWTDPNGFPHSGMLDPQVDVAGAYSYALLANAPCTGDQAEVVVTIAPAPNAGADAAISVCDQGAGVDLFAQLASADAGGTWAGPGGGPFTGVYEPATDGPGAYTYTVSGGVCPDDQAIVMVAETGSPDAGVDGVLEICSSTGPTALLAYLGPDAQMGGAWTAPGGGAHSGTLVPALDASGLYTYTISGTAPCTSSNASVMVTIEVAPDAGIDGSFTVCTGDAPFSLFEVLGGTPDADGIWLDILNAPFDGQFDPATSPQGMYNYVVMGSVCGADIATVEINVVPGPNAGQDNSVLLCESDAPLSLFGLLLGQPATNGGWTGPDGLFFNGTLDPATAQSGNYTYTVLTFGGGCPDAQAVIDVTISNTVDAGSLNNLTLCSTGAPIALLGQLSGDPDPGGAWTGPTGQPFAGIFDPASDAQGVYTYTVLAQAPCPSASASLNVEVNQQPVAGNDATIAMCSSDDPIPLLTLIGGAPDQGGAWTGPDGMPCSSQFLPDASGDGSYTYMLDGIAPCVDDQAVVTIAVSQAAIAGGNGAISVCADAGPFALFPLLGAGTDAGGSWSTPGGQPSDGTVQPGTDPAGAYTYTLTAPAPCPLVQATVAVTINEVPAPVIEVAMTDGCVPVEVSFSDAANAQGLHVWDFGTGDTSHATTPLPVLYDVAGVYSVTLTVTSNAGCTGSTLLADAVQVFTRPEAAFLTGPPNLNTGAPEAYFHNQSTGASFYEWFFDELGTSNEVNPRFTFPSALEGTYTVCLTAFASDNCYDTACVDIPVPAGAGLFIPNAFSPDGDGINEVFVPFVTGLKEQGYQFLIFDRWGKELFATTRMGEGWSGAFGNGDPAPIGVYVWKLIGRERYGTDRVDRTGHVTLVR